MRGHWVGIGKVAAVFVSLVAWGHPDDAIPILDDFKERNQITGGYENRVLRMDLDVTGDGAPELLLAKALRQGQLWDVYSWVGDKQLKHLGEAPFPYWAFLITSAPPTVVAPYALGDGRVGVATYQIDSSGVRRLSLDEPTKPGLPGPEEFDAWRQGVGLKVLAANLDDLEKNASPEWRDELSQQPVTAGGGLLDLRVVP